MNLIQKKAEGFIEETNKICKNFEREISDIVIIGASKTQKIESIKHAYNAGLRHFGENYLQEAEEKIKGLGVDVTWHFIGSIQKRKSRKIAELFDWVHTLERLDVAEKLNAGRSGNRNKLNVCIQINIDNEKSKSGIRLEEVNEFMEELKTMKNLVVRGLMAIPNPSNEYEDRILSFKNLKNKFEELKIQNDTIDTLSIGMSSDYHEAIAEGSTMIRIGTSIFGERS